MFLSPSARTVGFVLMAAAAGACGAADNFVEVTASELKVDDLKETFETYPAGSSVAEYYWFSLGNASMQVSDEAAGSGRHSYKLASSPDPSLGYGRAGAKFCKQTGSSTALSVKFRIRFDNFTNWAFIGISNSQQVALRWWLRNDGTIFDATTFAQLTAGTWYDVHILVDLVADLVTVDIGGLVHTAAISTTWGQLGAPIDCLRVATAAYAAQTLYVDDVRILEL